MGREVGQIEREQTEDDNAHMKGRHFKLRGDMKDSLRLLSLLFFFALCLPSSLSSPSSLSVSLLYIQAQTVNANKAFRHTELMYPLHFANVLPFKCHLLCCCCEYIFATVH